MKKPPSDRKLIFLECINCISSNNLNFHSSRYFTSKNRQTLPIKLELKKYCPYCRKHTKHMEQT
jgi:large subunit ribosomal protein L33